MTDDDVTRGTEPMDALTQLCDDMTAVLDAKGAEVEDVKAIVFLQNGKRGGIQLWGYDDDTEAMADLLYHLKALFRSSGRDLVLIPMADSPN